MMKNGQYKYLLVRMLRSWIIVSISAHKPYIKADTNQHKGKDAIKDGQYKYLSEKQLQKLALCAPTPLCTLWRALNIGLNSRSIYYIKKETQPLNIIPILPKEGKAPDMLVIPTAMPSGTSAFRFCPQLPAEANNYKKNQCCINMTILKRFSLLMARKEGY